MKDFFWKNFTRVCTVLHAVYTERIWNINVCEMFLVQKSSIYRQAADQFILLSPAYDRMKNCMPDVVWKDVIGEHENKRTNQIDPSKSEDKKHSTWQRGQRGWLLTLSISLSLLSNWKLGVRNNSYNDEYSDKCQHAWLIPLSKLLIYRGIINLMGSTFLDR